MSEPVVLVCGFGRCGSSMVMQMLSAGGMPCPDPYPSFEGPAASMFSFGSLPRAIWDQTAGQAVKMLNPRAERIMPGRARVIWLSRNATEQAKSMAKLLALEGIVINNQRRRAMAADLRRSIVPTVRALDASGTPLEMLTFEEILRRPYASSLRLAAFVGRPLDVEKMASVVRQRPPQCLPFLMEFELAESAHG